MELQLTLSDLKEKSRFKFAGYKTELVWIRVNDHTYGNDKKIRCFCPKTKEVEFFLPTALVELV